jgi:hypothetical protein
MHMRILNVIDQNIGHRRTANKIVNPRPAGFWIAILNVRLKNTSASYE